MTIQVVNPGAAGGIDYYVWPAGLTHYDNPIVSLPKVSATNMPVDTVISPKIRDISGDSAWDTGILHPKAVVTTAAGIGATTVLAKRTSYLSIPVFPYSIQNTIIPDSDTLAVVKPTGEQWFAGISAVIYGYINAGVTLYTSSGPTASGFPVCWIAGRSTRSRAISETDGYIAISSYIPGPPSLSWLNDLSSSVKGMVTIAVSTTGGVPQMGGSIYSNQAKSLVSSTASATTPIYLGNCAAQDKTVSPPIFSYFPANMASTAGQSFQRVTESINCFGKSFVHVYMLTGVMNDVLVHCTVADGNVSGVRDRILVPRLVHRDTSFTSFFTMPSLAYDPILPAPYDGLRIVWSGLSKVSRELAPLLVRRTTTAAPLSGMVRTGRPVETIEELSNVGISGSSMTISEYAFSSCSFAHGQKYHFGAAPEPGAGNLKSNNKRAGFIPSVVVQFGIGVSAVGLTAVYGIYEPYLNVYTPIPGYPPVTFTAGAPPFTWYGSMPSPATTYIDNDAVAQFCIIATPTAVAPGPVVNFKIIIPSPKDTIGVYPFDVVRCSTLSDSGGAWVGNYGWRFDALPMPTITWGAAPSAAYNSGTGIVTLSGFSTGTFSVAAGKGVITPYSGTLALADLYAVGWRADWIDLPADMQPATRGMTNVINNVTSGPITFSAGFKPVSGATTLRIVCYVQNNLKHPYALGEIKEYVIDVAVP